METEALNVQEMTPYVFPEDEEEDGFFNIGDKLVMSDFYLKLVLGAVEEVLAQATHLESRPKLKHEFFRSSH